MLIVIFSFLACPGDMADDRFAEVISDKLCPDFLLHTGSFSGMHVDQVKGIFQIPEGGLHAPYADILEMPINFW